MGAFAHCLITVALNQGLSHDSHGAFGRISQRLDAVHGGNEWRSRFGSAERLHFHFYHGNLPTEEVRSHRRARPSTFLRQSLGTSIPPPISTTSNLWMAADGTFFNRHNVRQSIRPGGPLYLRLLHPDGLRRFQILAHRVPGDAQFPGDPPDGTARPFHLVDLFHSAICLKHLRTVSADDATILGRVNSTSAISLIFTSAVTPQNHRRNPFPGWPAGGTRPTTKTPQAEGRWA